jgi:hypothetical protein
MIEMTQPKKPEKLIVPESKYPQNEQSYWYNQAIDKMEAYYQPIVGELVESLEKCIEQFQDVHFCQDCGREED